MAEGQVMHKLQVGEFFQNMQERLSLELVNTPKGLVRDITQKDLHRPGLALAGFIDLFTYDRMQILGNTEIRYLNSLSGADREQSLKRVFRFEIPCIIVSNSNKVPPELTAIADQSGVSIFVTPFTTTELAHLLSDYLDHRFAPSMIVHGSLVDVYGTGLLFTGRSGIGKSEVALDLVERGHRLVSDDVVTLTRTADNVIMGTGSELLKHYMEIRGVGIIDVGRMFGVRAIRLQKRVETEVELVDWSGEEDYERTGIEDAYKEYLGVKLPYVRLPIFPGKNVTVIAETIALNLHLKVYGFHPARQFSAALTDAMKSRKGIENYLEKDFE
ncbi:HPr(Ser) kinase/phosphatase [candidate division KSB1 bacterium]|nr:MAG: HPr(Ser) kinase/phosphatase [candidate division KSB1 bacterium]